MFHVKHAGPFCFPDGLRPSAHRDPNLTSKVLVRGASVHAGDVSAVILRLCGRERLATSVVFASRRVVGNAILLAIPLSTVSRSGHEQLDRAPLPWRVSAHIEAHKRFDRALPRGSVHG